MKTLLTVAFLLLSAPALAQTTREKIDVGLGLAGLSSASIALGLTMSCTSANACRENNPVVARWIGEGPVRATVAKSVANGASYYLVWRLTAKKPKIRTVALAAMAAINVWDAAHDIRQARK